MTGLIRMTPILVTSDFTYATTIFRRLRCGRIPQEQSETGADDVHRRAAAGAAGQLPAGLESGRPGPGADRPDHRTQ